MLRGCGWGGDRRQNQGRRNKKSRAQSADLLRLRHQPVLVHTRGYFFVATAAAGMVITHHPDRATNGRSTNACSIPPLRLPYLPSASPILILKDMTNRARRVPTDRRPLSPSHEVS